MFIKKYKIIFFFFFFFFGKETSKNIPKMKEDFQEKWSNLGHGKLGDVIVESHGISKDQE